MGKVAVGPSQDNAAVVQELVHLGVLLSGVAFIQKPFTSDPLLRKVRKVLDD